MNKIILLVVLIIISSNIFCQQEEHKRAMALKEQGKYQEAIKELSVAVRKNKDVSTERLYLLKRAQLYLDTKQYNKSIEDIEEIIKIQDEHYQIRATYDPEFFEGYIDDVYVTLGKAYEGLQQYKKANEAYTSGIIRIGFNKELYVNRGIVLTHKLKKTEEGIRDYKEVIKYEPNNFATYAFISQAYYIKNEYAKFFESLKGTPKPLSELPYFIDASILCYTATGQYVKALEMAKRYNCLFNNPKSKWRLAAQHILLGNDEIAQKIYKDMENTMSSDTTVLFFNYLEQAHLNFLLGKSCMLNRNLVYAKEIEDNFYISISEALCALLEKDYSMSGYYANEALKNAQDEVYKMFLYILGDILEALNKDESFKERYYATDKNDDLGIELLEQNFKQSEYNELKNNYTKVLVTQYVILLRWYNTLQPEEKSKIEHIIKNIKI